MRKHNKIISKFFGRRESLQTIVRPNAGKQDVDFFKEHKESRKNITGLTLFEAVCTNCNKRLATFYSKRGELNDQSQGVMLHTVYKRGVAEGCYGLNINEESGVYNFECCCKKKSVVEERAVKMGRVEVQGVKRYTNYIVKKV